MSIGINSNFLLLFICTKVEVTALSSYEEKEEQFKREVTCFYHYSKNNSLLATELMFVINVGFSTLDSAVVIFFSLIKVLVNDM